MHREIVVQADEQRRHVEHYVGTELEQHLFAHFFAPPCPVTTTRLESVYFVFNTLRDRRKWRLYRQRARHLRFNLRYKGERLGQMNAKYLAVEASSAEMWPERWPQLGKIESWNSEATVPESSMHKCAKCGSRRIEYSEMQTRAADEPMTQFYHCADCHKRWKQ